MCPRANACAAEWADAPVAMHDCLVGAPFAFAIRRQDGRRQGRRDAVEVAAHGGDDHSVLLRLLVGAFQQKHLSFLDVLTATRLGRPPPEMHDVLEADAFQREG